MKKINLVLLMRYITSLIKGKKNKEIDPYKKLKKYITEFKNKKSDKLQSIYNINIELLRLTHNYNILQASNNIKNLIELIEMNEIHNELGKKIIEKYDKLTDNYLYDFKNCLEKLLTKNISYDGRLYFGN